MEQVVGKPVYRGLLKSVARVWNLQESPEYGFALRFPVLRQQTQFVQNRSFSVLVRAILRLNGW